MLTQRLVGVFKLDAHVFWQIGHDPNATAQAALVVAVVAFLSASGNAIAAVIGDGSFARGFFISFVWTFFGWFLWSAVAYFVDTTLFFGKATLDEMLRVIGFAFAPQALGIIPCLGPFVGLLWSLIAGFVAVRHCLELDDTSACLTIFVGFLLYLAGFAPLGMFMGGFFWFL